MNPAETPAQQHLRLTAMIAAAYVRRNGGPLSQPAELIGIIAPTLATLTAEPPAAAPLRPAVPIGRSIQRDFIVCLEDGKRLKMLKRYLRTQYGLSPEDYRRRWGLSHDYPMVAPAYADRRSEFAKASGLGKRVRGSRR